MDLRDPMNFFAIAHRCKSTVAPRCIVASGQEHPFDQVVALQRPLVCVIVAALRCSHFIVAPRCTVANSHNRLFRKAQLCNGDRCSSSLIATPLSLERGLQRWDSSCELQDLPARANSDTGSVWSMSQEGQPIFGKISQPMAKRGGA